MLEGLEAVEIELHDLLNDNWTFRIDSEFFKKNYLKNIKQIKNFEEGYIKLNDAIIYMSGGATPLGAEYQTKGIPFLRVQNILPNYFSLDDVVYLSTKQDEEIKRSKLKEKDVLLTITGVSYGKSATVPKELENANINQHSVKISLNNKLNPYFLSTFLNCKYGKLQSDKNIVGITRPALDYEVIRNFTIPRISITFQIKIEMLIKLYEKIINIAQQSYTQAENLLLETVGLKDFESQYSDNYQEINLSNSFLATSRLDAEYYHSKPLSLIGLLKQRKHNKIKDLFEIKNGFPWRSEYFREVGEGEPFVRIRDCKPGYIDNKTLTTLDTKYANSLGIKKAQKDDIVIGMDGIKYFYGSLIQSPVYLNQRVCHLIPRINTGYNSELILLIINSIIGQTQLMREMTIAQTVGHITNSTIGNLIIPELEEKVRKTISFNIEKFNQIKKQSQQLLELAKTAVEKAIEENEELSVKYINQKLKELQIS